MAGPPITDPTSSHSDVKITGTCPQVTVKVDKEDVQCYLDTGSQVTLFSESLCNELFKNKERGGVLSWLRLRAVNALRIPYTGYIVADFQAGGGPGPGPWCSCS